MTDPYAIPQEFLDFRETIRRIAEERIRPRAAEIDRTGEYLWDIRELLAENDIMALPFAPEYGGTGTGTLMLEIAIEEIAKACASSALIMMGHELGSLPIQLFGTDEQKQRWLPSLASGERTPAFALSEPEAGSDPASMRTTAVRDDSEWVINGQKNWITNATIADLRRLREDRSRAARDHCLHRRGGPAGIRPREARAQARHTWVADRPAIVQRRPRAGRERDRRGRPRAARGARDARAHAPRGGRAGRGHRPGRARLRDRLRQRAGRLRRADHRAPGDPIQARRHAD